MRALVTGGAGFIGSHTVDLLLEKGYQVRVLDNLQPRVHPKGKPTWLSPEVEFIVGSVADRSTMERTVEDVDCVFHLAAYQDYMTDFSTFVHVNAESSALLFELILEKHLPIQKIVFASSQSVCGEGRYRCPEHGDTVPDPRRLEQLEQGDWEVHCPVCGEYMKPQLIDESTVSPGTTYGITKYTIELLAQRIGRRYGIPTVCMRYSYVQGPRNSFYNAYSGIARIFAMRIMNGLPPLCFEDGQQRRDYINVRDVARANVLAMEDDRANFQVFNVGGGRPVTVVEFADMMLQALESSQEPLVPGAFRVGDTRHTVSDISKMQALGWQPSIPVEQNVAEYVAWLLQSPEARQVTRESLIDAEQQMRAQRVIRQAKEGQWHGSA